MKTRQDYRALQKELFAIEKTTGLYLADEGIDYENVESKEEYDLDGDEVGTFWDDMYRAMTQAAGFRAEEAGQDINVLIGRVIY